MNKIFFPLFLLISFCFIVNARQSDFYIVTHPGKLPILNEYEQPLTDSEKRAIPGWFPLEITNANETLGDQITEAIRCTNCGNTYFLLRDDNGAIKGKETAILQKLVDCISLWDTMEITTSVTLTREFSGETKTATISKGEKVIRVLQKGNNTYVLRTREKSVYGWCKEKNIFRKIKNNEPAAVPSVNTADILRMITKRIESANEQYKSFFGFFNMHTNQQKSVPTWEIAAEGNNYRCLLKGSKQTISQMQESTDYIVQDLKHLLLGKPYSVTYENSCIFISAIQNNP